MQGLGGPRVKHDGGEQPLSPIRFLVVDDFEGWRHQVRSLFQVRPQWQIIAEVSDGSEAVQKVADLKPDLILLDIGLPKLNGIQAARRIRQLSPGTAVPQSKQTISSGNPPVVVPTL